MLKRVVSAQDEGTIFLPKPNKLRGRKRWIAFFHHPKGTLLVDDGARKALLERGKSLLSPGISGWTGEFSAGDVVGLCDLNGTEFARGIAKLSAADLRAAPRVKGEVVHRDDLVIL